MRALRRGLRIGSVARLLDFRTAEERRVAIVRYNKEFAFWQAEFVEREKKTRWERLRKAIG